MSDFEELLRRRQEAMIAQLQENIITWFSGLKDPKNREAAVKTIATLGQGLLEGALEPGFQQSRKTLMIIDNVWPLVPHHVRGEAQLLRNQLNSIICSYESLETRAENAVRFRTMRHPILGDSYFPRANVMIGIDDTETGRWYLASVREGNVEECERLYGIPFKEVKERALRTLNVSAAILDAKAGDKRVNLIPEGFDPEHTLAVIAARRYHAFFSSRAVK